MVSFGTSLHRKQGILIVCFFCLCRGGIQDGDIIVKVNGRPLMTSSDLQEAVMNESPLLLEVRRGNDDLLFNIEPEIVM